MEYLTRYEQLCTQHICIWFYKYGTSRVQTKISLHRERKILLTGLDAAGKTSILYKLKLDKIVDTYPMIMCITETIEYKNIALNIWDLCGDERLRPQWNKYYSGTHAVIYVVDCNDPDRMQESREELHKMLAEEMLRNAVLLIFANKQDLPCALTCLEITDTLGLNTILDRPWFIKSTSMIDGDALIEGLEWLSK